MFLKNTAGTELEVIGCWPATEELVLSEVIVNQFASNPPVDRLVCCLATTSCSFEHIEFIGTVYDPISEEDYDVFQLLPDWYIA